MRGNISRAKERYIPKGIFGFIIFTIALFFVIGALPSLELNESAFYIFTGIGLLALWRYSWGLLHFVRSLYYRHSIFPKWRKRVDARAEELMPSKIYILMTLFRIDPAIASRAINAALEEAIRSKVPVTFVASIVELQDERLLKSLLKRFDLPDHVNIKISRMPGKGKRVGLAHGFKAISRDNPPADAVAVVMDGDTILLPGTLQKSVPFFKAMPGLGALTTDELSELPHGSKAMREWHDMRFAQRQLLMSSISLSKRVMTLTGRMSMFRADIVTDPRFIAHITEDELNHWRLGRFKFLTGDDKSSLYWVMKQGYQQIYLPDVNVLTVEDPPSDNFFKASTQLMFRWFGNMLRTNARIVKLGFRRMPFFVWWSFVDQRLSMWTTLAGPTFAILLSIQFGTVVLLYYLVWVAFIRWIMALMLLSARNEISWRYPFLLYYGQIYGALMKSWVLFRLDVQSWTRQKTKLDRGLKKSAVRWNVWTSHITHAAAILALVCAIGYATDLFELPHTTIRVLSQNSYAGSL